MLFNSLDFAIFLPIVFILYWFFTQNNLKLQNTLIVISSYIFYGWWDWRFLGLIIFSTIVDYIIGICLLKQQDQKWRKIYLSISVVINLGFLGFFKYYNFFVKEFVDAFSFLGYHIPSSSLNIILPVGISFYTFQTLSYSIDVYNRKLLATKDFIAFSAFVCFFPQLVAGPIERAVHLLPQFYKKRKFNYELAVDGLRQILWGIFKKIVIADNCATYANLIFNDSDNYSGSTLFVGALFFTFQIYGDFSGYSDIAIGVSRLFGFDLMQNFKFPYFSRSIAEFWRKWHISLSTWFRDYLYIPLGGSKGSLFKTIRNIFVIFIVSGFWHGANWTFVIWGALNALYILPSIFFKTNRNNLDTIAQGNCFPSLGEFISMTLTFMATVLAWIFFRSNSVTHAVSILDKIFSKSIFSLPEIRPTNIFVLLFVFMLIEWFGREDQFAIQRINTKYNKVLRVSFYYLLVLFILYYSGSKQEFIYFQF